MTLSSFLSARRMLQWLVLFVVVALLRVPAHAADDFLPPEQAFRFSATQVDGQTVEVRFGIADGYYMYRERFAVGADPAIVTLAPLDMPPGKVKFDETFNKDVETYRHEVAFRVKAPNADSPFTLIVTSQGCADQGLCYPPMKSRFQVRPSPASAVPMAPAATAADSIEPEGRQGRIASTLDSGNFGAIAALFFGLGLLLTFTPCVLPMLPIVSAIVVGEHATRMRAALVSVAYVLGMAIVYTALGVAAGLAGQGLQAALQNAWVLGAFALLIALLSLSMFGLYELQLPAAWHHHLTQASNKLSGGQVVGAAVMGALSALIVSPCVTAPLAGALVYISQTGNAAVGGTALFALSIGMGVPLILVGVGAGNLLPRSGRWLVVTKAVFGFILLAVAWYIVQPVLPAWVAMAGWGTLLIGAAVFLRTFDSLPDGASNVQRLGKVIGVVLALAGVAQLVGVAAGGRDPLQPLAGVLRTSTMTNAPTLTFKRVKSVTELDAEVRNASAAGKPVMLDFYADWCVSCKEMEHLTFTDARVRAALADVVLLQADVTANTADDQALLKRFGLFGPPGTVFFDVRGREAQARVIGFQRADTFLASLRRALGTAQAAKPST
ncbi:protein-disulfide reductase DsbD [Ralstonia mannitolilytica]|uniref:Thiol:disulfide interchange protein DsbD n=1 Tax=Ralstonia mannitolilytica TaxID=105219 RepID=A0AAD2ELC9_9RALS|nr:protein-disulfide reductase DsbD [Ralstonia mannitolilytica]ATG18731.1 thiol:disulfide interchange protein [Ralstonia pickettii]MBY4720652.1 protein-disulfide reductase DsbD [Ralstonia mannitolilytica]CAJ0686559.1 Thiol:disulfide interchange protein DsbD [Ralstonia mannitolilytica]CAJ0702488.1 Thiol:disulfide interchange protein DsbD [Ralstonia mannitolilytica]CAJ0717119.1 Thiol:disulfide interchange protein DsbD [Ralstonia mannitolilytica]